METIDPKIGEFKLRVEREWAGDETAAAWRKYHPQMREQFKLVTQALVNAADPVPGMAVLDLASGTGEPALSLAQRVAPAGTVTATDLSQGMLAALRENASVEGLTNVETRTCDAEELPFSHGSFDLVTSRFGVMFFVNAGRALAGIRRVLKPGGSAVFMVWGAPEPGSYFGTAAMPYIRRLAAKPDPESPGPMRFAESGKLARVVKSAGFTKVKETSHSFPAPFRGSPRDLLTCMMEIAAPFRNAAASLPESDRRAAEEEAYQNLDACYDGATTNVTAPVIIVTGRSG